MIPITIARLGGQVGIALALGLIGPGAGAALPLNTIAPAFTARTLDRRPLRLRDLRGRVVLLDFWAVDCPPCRVEMPRLQALYRRYAGQGLRVVGVTQMDPKPAAARRALHQLGVTYPVLLDPGERIGRQYRLEAHPTTVLIDRQGVVRRVDTGFLIGDEKEIEAALRPLLATPRGGP